MKFSQTAVSLYFLSLSSTTAFSPVLDRTGMSRNQRSESINSDSVSSALSTRAGLAPAVHSHKTAGCNCPKCRSFVLFADAVEEVAPVEESADDDASPAPLEAVAEDDAAPVPAEVEAMDGIESSEEAHNADRPARKSISKKGPRGKPLSEMTVGETVTGKVRAVASYGAFVDVGAQSDGLLHISQLSVEYVADVGSVVEVGQDIEVRILSVDEGKNQIALSLLSEAQVEEAEEAASQRSRKPRQDRPRQQQRRDDSAVLSQLREKGWSEEFVEGSVVSTVAFGAFVRVDASNLNSEVEGSLDGLVHISALAAGRVDSVNSVVNVDDKVQVRVKDISDGKVALSMVSAEDEEAKRGESGGAVEELPGNKNWKADMEEVLKDTPEFMNKPLVVDLRQ